MKRRFSPILFYIFISAALVFANESKDDLRKYLSDMNKIFIEVSQATRSLSLKILPPKNVAEQISASIKKFEVLEPPSIFLKDHYNMLSAFKSIRDGFELFSEGEREKSVEMVKEGSALLKNTAIEIKRKAEQEGLIPVKPKTAESTKPILPSQTPSVIAGTSPTPSPHIASPQIESDFITVETAPSTDVKLTDIPDTVNIATILLATPPSSQDMNLPGVLTAVGEIISIEPHEDYFIIGLRDDSGNILEIDLKPEVCSIMEDSKIVTIERINKEASLYILYTQNKGRNNAAFINILKPEDANILKKSIKPGSSAPPTLEKPAQNN